MKNKMKQGSKPTAVLSPGSSNGHGSYAIGDRAVLVDLTIHRWTPKIVDKKVSQEVATKNNSDATMGRYEKDLLDSKALSGITSATNALRTTHKYLTCPWTEGGVGILASAGYFHYNEEIMKLVQRFDKEADELCAPANYAKHIKYAEKHLGDLWNPNEYPTAEKLRKAYGVDIRILPVPDASQYSGALGTYLGDEIGRIQKSTGDYVKSAVESAMKSVYARLAQVVETAAEKLKAFERLEDGTVPEGLGFKSSLITNITDLLDILPSLNLTGDPQLSIFAERIRTEIASADVDSLKHDGTLRKTTAKAADDILKHMAGYFA